jgi:aminoglycoside phosphotransferase (APT) family kinase protein
MAFEEFDLPGGRVTPGVVRVGQTVRRPTGEHSPFVHSLLKFLEERRVEHVPRLHGIDEKGREILDYIDGWVPPNLEDRRWSDDQIVAAAQIVRAVHAATAESDLAGDAEVVCHGDLSPCNFVFVSEHPVALIDFDRARPGSRRADLAYMAWGWLVGSEDPADSPPIEERLRRLRLLLDTYGLADRAAFAATILEQQHETLALHERRNNSEGSAWVRAEIAFVQMHASEIDAAVRGRGP